jgi:hypothetical protein
MTDMGGSPEGYMGLMSLGEAAEWFAEIEPDFPASYFRRQLKHYTQLGLIKPPAQRGFGRTSAALLGERQVCAAYLFSTLTRLGLRAETLRWVARYFDYIGVRRSGQDEYFGSLNEVIRTTKAGDRWFLIVKIRDWSESESWERPSVDAEFRSQADVTSDAGDHRAVVVLDCQHLLRPLLDALHKQEQPVLAVSHRGEPGESAGIETSEVSEQTSQEGDPELAA